MQSHYPNLGSLEMHITYKCNLACNNCTNLIGLAPAPKLDMTLEQIEEFCEESTAVRFPWKRIVMHGGEPTLHPEFERICDLLYEFQVHFPPGNYMPSPTIALCTNGMLPKTKTRIKYARERGIAIENSNKEGAAGNPGNTPDYHVEFNVAPIDTGEGYNLGCYQSSRCGIALNHAGFFECSPAASMMRVFGWKPLARSVAELSVALLAAGYKQHCQFCGLSRDHHPKALEQVTSATWAQKLELYRNQQKP